MSWPVPESLDTPRLRLRRCRAGDADAFVAFMSDAEATRYLLFTDEQKTPDAARAMIEAVIASYDSSEPIFVLAIALRDDDRYIGSCGLSPTEDGGVECYYTIAREHWGNGYAAEATAALLRYAFDVLGLDEVVANMSVENPASARVAQKVGMTGGGARYVAKASTFNSAQ